jgi:hypothetical protein
MLNYLLLAVASVVLFPGSESAPSPNGHFLLQYRAPEPGVAAHRLFLAPLPSGASSLVYSFNRHASVLWAPDSSHFAITDWNGSDEARVIVMSAAAPTASVVLDPARIRAGGSIELAPDHHLYVEASRWLSEQELLLRVHGYGQAHPKGFERFLVYSIPRQSITERPAGT